MGMKTPMTQTKEIAARTFMATLSTVVTACEKEYIDPWRAIFDAHDARKRRVQEKPEGTE